jgi:hypothetical protein
MSIFDIKIEEEELYNRAFFHFIYKNELINVVFEPTDEDDSDYMCIVFTESMNQLPDIETDEDFQLILSDILFKFHAGEELKYIFRITC